ncbi:MAG: response regulator transcription factor [Candidatus Izemoplasmatales bacterium]|nr:response regulator transcription factor [Candidatus Izemoplasmatales bacterium]
MFKVLVVEDDDYIRKLMTKYLINSGFDVIQALNGQDALSFFEEQHIDIVITDIMMPVMDGNRLVKSIRNRNKDIPILMLTALESFFDKEKGFESGTDDYLVKPIDMKELLLHVKALLRRYKIVSENKIEYKSISLDYHTFQVCVSGESVELTKKEFLLLYKLFANPNIIYTRNQLMDEIWGYDSDSFDRTVDTHIKRIREKIKSEDIEVITVRGLGYKVVIK